MTVSPLERLQMPLACRGRDELCDPRPEFRELRPKPSILDLASLPMGDAIAPQQFIAHPHPSAL
ncbi:hypothetical protein VSX64_16195 [Aurantimonas sp. C2-6-R+9]|uniref:hypothetical protein n=1 Tax=unclassified Aurantimonas TaxID=2638230 RepID=UPI002E18F454|nr:MULTISPECIES: hypothetical protein [unclassified Aurantimonas]MEC5291821.1 hypothetical protein [Aurantimonas sp. C2-3-R2]MEC5382404.1 hypothetical protein [Aurantimonas sp. C2-6-R+9]MEC5412892.1 hypothetical protein [Aurantimonas sp. C2-4-R8]